MRLRTRLGILEGTPDEIRAVLHDEAPDADTAAARTRQLTLGLEAVPDRAPLRAVPTNELLQHDFATDLQVTAATRQAYASAVLEFERIVAPRSLLDATVDDARAFAARLDAACKAERWTRLAGPHGAGPERVRCDLGEYTWTIVKPDACSRAACPMWRPRASATLGRLKGVRAFYDWLVLRGLVRSNPVTAVAKQYQRTTLAEDDAAEDARYEPSLAEVRMLLHAVACRPRPEPDPVLRDALALRDTAMILLLAKTWRRPGHVLLLDADDVRDLDGEYPHLSFRGVRERLKAAKGGPLTKLKGNLLATLDAETSTFLRRYLAAREQAWGLPPDGGALFPGTRARDRYDPNNLQGYVLDPALQHLETTDPERADAWRAMRTPRHPRRLSPACFRVFGTNQGEDLGMTREDRLTHRGDRLNGAIEKYRRPTPERLARSYRMPELLTDPAFGAVVP